jgi:hypothetical protein
MPSASNRPRKPGPPVLWVGLALAGAIVAVTLTVLPPTGRLPVPGPAAVGPSAFLAPGKTTVLTAAGRLRLRTASWWGHVYTSSTGETVNVSISDSYPADDAVGQGWADYFAGLVHGSELQLLHVFVAAPAEVQQMCGSPYALGCYGSNQMVVIGEQYNGLDPKEVAAHEYGHHVAFNRINPPWIAVDWGTKRWASYAGICGRTAQGTAFPGDEGTHYRLNPGEAFAEVYRTLNDAKKGIALTWPIVDSSFVPNSAAMQAAEEDVVHPWTVATSKAVQARFTVRGTKVWKLVLPTPLDGQLDVVLSIPKGGLYNLSLLAPDGITVLAGGLWSGTNQKKLSYTVCGQRSLVLRVTMIGLPGSFTLRYTQP